MIKPGGNRLVIDVPLTECSCDSLSTSGPLEAAVPSRASPLTATTRDTRKTIPPNLLSVVTGQQGRPLGQQRAVL